MENIDSNISSSEELVGIDEVQKFLNRSRASVYRYTNTDLRNLNPSFNPRKLNPEYRTDQKDPLRFHPNEIARFAKDILRIKEVTVEVFNSPKEVIASYKNNSEQKDLYVIGGTYIYELFFEYCEYLYITYVDKEYLGDAFFPKVDWNKWKLIGEESRYDEKEEVKFYFRNYERN